MTERPVQWGGRLADRSRTSLSALALRYPSAVSFARSVLPLRAKRALGSVLLRFVSPGGIVTAQDGRRFVSTRDRVFLQVAYDGIYEPALTRFIAACLREGDIAVDVGASFGWYATLMGRVADTVIAYEPASHPRALLERNVSLNGMAARVVVRDVAASDQPGHAWLVVDGDSVRDSALGRLSSSRSDGERVQVVRLDDDLARYVGAIAVMKIDAEGYELRALAGAGEVLAADDPPIVVIEANVKALRDAGASRAALVAEFRAHGYALMAMRPDGSLFRDEGGAPALAAIPGRGVYARRIMSPPR